MLEIIGVRFKSGGKQYFFDPQGIQVAEGQDVIVETSRGAEFGQCVQANREVREEAVMQPLRPLIRIATEEDQKILAKNLEKQEKAFQICQEKIAAHGLDMKLVDAEYSFEGNKVLFFFTAEGRVDFRALVKDLAGTIHAALSCVRSVCATKRRCWVVWASADGPSAVLSSWMSSSPCLSRWQRLRICPSIPPRSRAPAAA